jgi:hypothetical protein
MANATAATGKTYRKGMIEPSFWSAGHDRATPRYMLIIIVLELKCRTSYNSQDFSIEELT